MKTEYEAICQTVGENVNGFKFNKQKNPSKLISYDFLKNSSFENREELIDQLDQISSYINACNETYENRAFRQLGAGISFKQKIKIFFKRAERKLIKWYIEPIADQQTSYNENSLNCLILTTNMYISSLKREDELNKKIADISKDKK